jgi:cytochrome c biogenesis protein CcmG/thiol:disulfide interchange protein DsbE
VGITDPRGGSTIPNRPAEPTGGVPSQPMRSRLILAFAVVVLAAVVTVGLLQGGGSATSRSVAPSASQAASELAGSPPPLARLHARADVLLDAKSAKAELTALKGYPVVVNKWASWCGPCRAEFPTFQAVSVELGKQVAFLGLNAGDGPKPAAAFLKKFPTSFPSISDPDLQAVTALGIGGSFWPTTAFFDAAGRQTYAHQGPYLSAADLKADIAKYAIRG